MIAHSVAGNQINDSTVPAGLQALHSGLPDEGFAQIFQQKTEMSAAASLSRNLAENVPAAGPQSPLKSSSPIKEDPERATDPSATESALKAVQQALPTAGKLLKKSLEKQIVGEVSPPALAETPPNADILPPKAESASDHPSSEVEPPALPTESPVPESIPIVRPATEGVVTAIASTKVLPFSVETTTGTNPAHLVRGGQKGNSEKAVDATCKQQTSDHTSQTGHATVNNTPVELISSSLSLVTPTQTSASEVNQSPTQQLHSSAGQASESGHLPTTPITLNVVDLAETTLLNQQAKNIHSVVPSIALEGDSKSVERLNSSINATASKHAVDSPSAAFAPALESAPPAASAHPAVFSASASTTDRSPIDAAPVQAIATAVTPGGVLHPHVALPPEGLSEPLMAISTPGVAHTTLSATPTSLEVGVANSSHGWLKIRAELAGNGDVSASLTGGSAGAAEKLRGDLSALSSYLQGEKIQVSSISVHAVAVVAPSSSPEARSSSALFERSGNDLASSLAGGFSEGRQGGQPQQPSGDAGPERNPLIQEGGEAAVLSSHLSKDAGAYGVERRQELDGSATLPSVRYGAGGGWLNVRA